MVDEIVGDVEAVGVVGGGGVFFEEGGSGYFEALFSEFVCFCVPFFVLSQIGVEDDVSVFDWLEEFRFNIMASVGGHPEVIWVEAGHDDC